MNSDQRKSIFFLRANDLHFKPHLYPISKSIITKLYEVGGTKHKFTEIKFDNENGKYFIIAAPSTWPPFVAKMKTLLSFLAKLVNIKTIFVYLTEAHARDVWPLGFDIINPKTLEERKKNCNSLFQKFPALRAQIDGIFVDNMENDFNCLTGVWPEAYMFADSNGIAIWKSQIEIKGTTSLEQAIKFA